jgi:hypothetical protein
MQIADSELLHLEQVGDVMLWRAALEAPYQ